MAADGYTAAGQNREPSVSSAYGARRVEQPHLLLAGRQAGEALLHRVVVGDEQLLAVQHGWIGGARVVAEV